MVGQRLCNELPDEMSGSLALRPAGPSRRIWCGRATCQSPVAPKRPGHWRVLAACLLAAACTLAACTLAACLLTVCSLPAVRSLLARRLLACCHFARCQHAPYAGSLHLGRQPALWRHAHWLSAHWQLARWLHTMHSSLAAGAMHIATTRNTTLGSGGPLTQGLHDRKVSAQGITRLVHPLVPTDMDSSAILKQLHRVNDPRCVLGRRTLGTRLREHLDCLAQARRNARDAQGVTGNWTLPADTR